MTYTDGVVRQLDDLRAAALPATVVERTRHMLLDWTAVTMAGAVQPSGRIAAAVAATEAPAGGPCTVVGTSVRAGAQAAALANGIAAHVLDYDDGNRWAGAHPSAPVVSAVAALAEELDATGSQLVEAIVAGVQALCLVGYASGPEHYARGFHTTGTIGTFGAAAGCARLLELDAPATARTLSLAATQAAGLKAMFGTMGKHLNAGRAAAAGVLAARLAADGFDAPGEAIEGRQGFAATQSPGFRADRRRPDARYGVEHVLFKRYACCADAHSAIEGVRAIAARREVRPADVAAVDLAVADGLIDVCDVARPTTGTQGRFSVRYATALALCGSPAGPDDFTDDAVRRPELVDLTARVGVHVDHHGHAADPITVTVRFRDGSVEHASVDPLVPVLDSDLDEQWVALSRKASALVMPLLGDARTTDLFDAIRALPDTSTRDLLATCVP